MLALGTKDTTQQVQGTARWTPNENVPSPSRESALEGECSTALHLTWNRCRPRRCRSFVSLSRALASELAHVNPILGAG